MSITFNKKNIKKLNFWSTGVGLLIIQFIMFSLMTGIVTGIPKIINITNSILNSVLVLIVFVGMISTLIWITLQVVEVEK